MSQVAASALRRARDRPILTDRSIDIDSPPRAIAAVAGIAWLVCAASLASAAASQASIPSQQRWGGAAVTSLASAIAIYVGLRLLTTPRRRYLQGSLLWAILVAAAAAFDADHLPDVFVLPVLWASAACVVSVLG